MPMQITASEVNVQVTHTPNGATMIKNFVLKVVGCSWAHLMTAHADSLVHRTCGWPQILQVLL